MSLKKFITKLLNVKDSDLQELISLEKSDGSIDFQVKTQSEDYRMSFLWNPCDDPRILSKEANPFHFCTS